jgi:hypothetical protein
MLHPVSIEPEAVYDDGSLRQTFGLTDSTLSAARRSGSLRFTRQGKRVLYLGKWITSWLESQAAPQSEAARREEGTAR